MDLIPIRLILVSILIFYSSSSSSIEDHDSKLYIVHLDSPESKVLENSEELENWYHSILSSSHRDPRMVYTYKNVFTGFAAWLSEDDVKTLHEHDKFLHARPQREYPLHTTHSPNFLGLNPNFGLWKNTNYGKGVIIGVVDTGIFPDHPSFNDKGMPPPPAKWKGKCEFKNMTSACNNKLIGARYFAGDSPLDESNGHGTHAASTAAGNFVTGVDFFGLAGGTASGVAPMAHLAVYKACRGRSCREIDVIAAMDAAIEDGVDVLSLSLGFGSKFFAYEANALGAFSAIQKGVFVSGSASNDGPSYETLSNEAPWILTVGASTMDRKFEASVLLPNNEEIVGEALIQPKNFESSYFPLVTFDSCDSMQLNTTDVMGKFVVCGLRNRSSSSNAAGVRAAGGEGMIIINPESEGLITSIHQPVSLPSSQISFSDGLKIRAYINSASSPTAALRFKGTVIGDEKSPIVASFSSRGPSIASPGILKPDIIGPGVNILAAGPESTFTMKSGTSMSCPHLSGVAALLKSSHPDWTPAAIKSAIMSTADTVNLARSPIEDERLVPADVFATGAGHVNPSRANDPGLVYDIEPLDYIPYLCGLNYTDREVIMITQERVKCSNVSSIAETQLNYPSFSMIFGSGVQRYTRTVTNVGKANSSYVVEITQPRGVYVEVEPSRLDFTKLGQKMTYSVTFRRQELVGNFKSAGYFNFSQGSLKWSFDKYTVTSPIVALFEN